MFSLLGNPSLRIKYVSLSQADITLLSVKNIRTTLDSFVTTKFCQSYSRFERHFIIQETLEKGNQIKPSLSYLLTRLPIKTGNILNQIS